MTSQHLPLDGHPATPSTDPERLFGAGRASACIGAVALVSLIAFEAMAVAAVMPAVAQAVDGLGAYALAFGGPLAASVLGIVWAGRACDRQGAAPPTAWGLALFALGLMLSGTAQGMAQVVAGRVIQGLGGGMVGVALYAGMGQLVPQALHPRLFSLFSTAWVVPGLVGPAIATGLAAQLGWRSVFLVAAAAAPIAAALLLPALWRQAPPSGHGGDTLDRGPQRIVWAACAAAGALLMHGASGGSASALLLPLAGLAAAALAAHRLLPSGTLRAARGLPAVIAVRAVLAGAFFTAEAFVPLALTQRQGWTLTQAGAALSVGAVCWSAGSWVQSRLQGTARRRAGLVAGLLLVGAGIAALALVLIGGLPGAAAVAAWAITGFGIGLSFPMLSVLTLSLSSAHDQGRHASALQLADALGSSAALALAGLLFTAAGGAPGLAGFVAVLALAVALALVGAAVGRRAFASPG
jgi:MFS family permease